MALKGTPMPAPKDQFAAEMMSPSSSLSFAKLTTLEVTVLYAEDVVIGEHRRRPLEGGAYATVHTDASAARTGFNDENGHCNGYPYWGEAVRLTVSERAKAIDVEIYRTRGDGRQESVAAARVPVADFSVGPPGHLHCLSYRLFDTGSRTRSRNGIVNITVKRLDGAPARAAAPMSEGKGARAVEDAASGTGDSCCGGVAGEGKKVPTAAAAPAGTVMGFPVGFSAAARANGKGSV